MAAPVVAVLLGVTAIGMLLFGVFVPAVSLAAGQLSGSAAVAVVLVGAVSVAAGIVAGFATWAVAAERQAGAMIGAAIGVVLVLTSIVAALSGGWHPALWVAVAMGTTLVALTSMILAARSRKVLDQR